MIPGMSNESFRKEEQPVSAEKEPIAPAAESEPEKAPLVEAVDDLVIAEKEEALSKLRSELQDWGQEKAQAELVPQEEERAEEFLQRVTQAFIDDKSGVGAKMVFEKGMNIQNDPQYQAVMREAVGHLEALDALPHEKFSAEKNQRTLEKVASLIGKATNRGKEEEGTVSYAHTNQVRSFRGKANKADNTPYAHSLFRLGLESAEADAYLARKLEGKRIVLLGGGNSLDDLLHAKDIHPAEVVNVDPFITQEKLERNDGTPYRSVPFRAEDPGLVEALRSEGVGEADEVWSSYSVPYYLDSAEDIAGLFANVRGLLAEDGSARITPLKLQSVEGNQEQFESASEQILAEVSSLLDDAGYNAYVVGETLVIEKLPDAEQSAS